MEYEKLESLFKILLLTGGVAAVVLHLIRFLPLSIQALRNSRAGIETRSAKVLYKNPKPDYLFQGRVGSTVYYITFRTDLGEAVTLYLNPRDYFSLEEGQEGTLTWQGTRFWSFEKNPSNPI